MVNRERQVLSIHHLPFTIYGCSSSLIFAVVFDKEREHLSLLAGQVEVGQTETDFGEVVGDRAAKCEPTFARQPAADIDDLILCSVGFGLNETSRLAETGDIPVAGTIFAQPPVTRQRRFHPLAIFSIIHNELKDEQIRMKKHESENRM